MSSTNPNPPSSNMVEEEEPLSLSALVRTAETSRLRRRGAINGGHRGSRQSVTSFAGVGGSDTAAPAASNGSSSTQQTPWARWALPPSTPFAQNPPPPWAEGGPAYPTWASVPDPAKADDDENASRAGHALYCGVDEWEFGTEEPFEPSPLPMSHDPAPSGRSHQRTPPPQRHRRSTGCGALIHTSGLPRTKNWTWQAYGKATADVVPLDKMYFERGGQPKQFACGCRWHGVGCSNCGNTLGNIYIPCQAASASPTLTRSQSRSSRGGRAQQSNASAHFMYTFFSDAVSSSPSFSFPKCPSSTSHGPRLNGPLAAASQAWEGVSASAMGMVGDDPEYAYGYAEQEQEQEQDEPGAEYDPNGVLITNVPGSPDKAAEPMLWPAR